MQVWAQLELNIKLKFDHYSMEHHQFEDAITYLWSMLTHLVNNKHSFQSASSSIARVEHQAPVRSSFPITQWSTIILKTSLLN
jgi:hypothetical protein